MTHFDDLSACTYFGTEFGPLVAVGWLEPGFEYSQGAPKTGFFDRFRSTDQPSLSRGRLDIPGQEFYDRLRWLLKANWSPIHFLGFQSCGFCRFDRSGSRENLFVPAHGKTYAVPEGILHYIAAHGYWPPDEFCEAVMECPEVATPAYFEALRANGWPAESATPEQVDAAWEAVKAQATVLAVLGNILAMRIEKYHTASGTLPASLAETEELTLDLSAWHYEVTETGYILRSIKRPEQNFYLNWLPSRRDWTLIYKPKDNTVMCPFGHGPAEFDR